MKKFLTVIATTIALMSLTSCGNRSSKTASDTEAAVVDTMAVDTTAVDTVVVE